MEQYDHKKIEKKWQKKWEEEKSFVTQDKAAGRNNYYALVEFPYPSGNLHIGHWYAFAVPDIFVRYKRMKGNNVLYPIGFDSFGLPAENAAIKRGIDPRKWTYGNIAHMQTQLKSMGNSFDWSREIITSDPKYYRWTQWLFLRLYEKGLVERKKSSVNYCEQCKTVLANEQVVHGKCERCSTMVTQKELEQWFFKITDYADRLLDDLKELDWPEEIKLSQRNWIGRSEGAEIEFSLPPTPYPLPPIKVFTTRPDTLFGATYMVLAPEHPLVEQLVEQIENKDEAIAYIVQSRKKTEIERTAEGKEKTGVELKGIKAINHANNEEIPVWVADYVLAHVGTGAIMAVPAHDARDFAFAKKYDLPIKMVVCPHYPAATCPVLDEAYTGEGHLVDSGKFNGTPNENAKKAITEFVSGEAKSTYRLRDWLISRQRYWGCPIPIVYDPNGKPHLVPEKHLPWLLPQDVDFEPTGKSPLATSRELHERTEKIFGKDWKPEVDTMDTFVDSSWYFLRYLDPHNDKEFCSKKAQKQWMSVDRYSGGAEHTTMHLFYSRFFHKALFDLGLVDDKEPYKARLNRGIILGPDGNKMSKSKGNVIDPDEQVERVGADTIKMYLAFIGPYNEVGAYPWDLGGIAGIRRFLERVWRLKRKALVSAEAVAGKQSMKLETLLHQTIKKVGEDIGSFKFNTAISALMILTNAMEKEETISIHDFSTLLRLLAPFAPHMTEELWCEFGHGASIHKEPWSEYDESKIVEVSKIIVVQVNGKVRGSIVAEMGYKQEELEKQAEELPVIQKWINGKKIKKVVHVKDKLVNFVVVD